MKPRSKKDVTQSTEENQSTSIVTEDTPESQVTKIVTPSSPAVSGLPPLAPLPEPSEEIFDKPQLSGNKLSSSGDSWDQSIHEDPPRENARGGWARRRGGARRSTASHAADPHTTTPELNPQDIAQKLDATASLAAGMLFLIGEMVIGQCMKPDADERAGITSAFRDYFQATNTVEIPPWLGLVGVTAVYVGRRWTHPQFEEKRSKWFPKEKSSDV